MDFDLGKVGVWMSSSIWRGHEDELAQRAIQLERLGFKALWLGGVGADLAAPEAALRATDRLVLATGIVNIWINPAPDLAASFARLTAEFPGRLLIGVGAGHKARLDSTVVRYSRPYTAISRYLDELDEAGMLPAEHRVLAALGPKMVGLAGERTAGAHPFLVTPSHTARSRDILGPGPLLAPEQAIVFESDAQTARAIGRERIAKHLALANYQASFRRQGFTDSDIASGSDRIVDALVGWGDGVSIAGTIRAQLDAGADHVPVQVFTRERRIPGSEYEMLRDIAADIA